MSEIISVVISIAVLLATISIVRRKCRCIPALGSQRRLLLRFVLGWALIAIVHMNLWSPTGFSYDGLSHDREARALASSIGRGDFPTSLDQYVGNPGFRTLLAVFYTVTNASPAAVYAISASLGFLGLLSVLEAICITSRTNEIPKWAIRLTFALPSALLWLPLILKEGPVVFGIGTLLKAYTEWQAGSPFVRAASRNVLGFSFLFFLRPHICLAWIMALSVGTVTHGKSVRRSITIAVLAVPLCIGALYGFQAVNPQFAEEIKESGTDSLDTFREKSGGDGNTAMGGGGGGVSNFLSGLNVVLFSSMTHAGSGLLWIILGLEATACTGIAVYHCAYRRKIWLASRFPLFMSSLYAMLLMAFFLGFMYNMGLAARQRLQVVPAILIVAILPALLTKSAPTIRETAVR